MICSNCGRVGQDIEIPENVTVKGGVGTVNECKLLNEDKTDYISIALCVSCEVELTAISEMPSTNAEQQPSE